MGVVHVREAPAALVRFPFDEPDGPSTLIVARDDRPEGVAVGRGDVTAVEAGSVRSIRWARPALRATVDTGPVILTFATEAERDTAAAAIIAEAGLGKPDPSPSEEGTWTPGS